MPPGKRKGPSSSSSKRGRSELDKLAAASDSDNEDGLLQLHDGTAAADSDELGGFDEEAVYGLDDDDSDEDEDEGESEDDEEDDEDVLEEALLRGGKQAQLAKQAQYLQQKLKLQQREDESDEDEEGGDDDEQQQQRGEQTLGDKLWGANKRAYYQTEDAEVDSDDALAQEEQEARQLQAAQAAALDDDDYALPGLDAAAAAAAAGGDGDGAGSGPVSLAAAAAGGAGGVEVETVARDVEGLTAEQQAAVVMSDAPELLSLLAELRDSLAEVRGRIGPLLREVSTGGLATSAGLSYLEAKHLLLLQYCMCIVAYLLIKAEGRSVVGHPVLHRLAQLRVYIEKIRPIDKQLSYQVDKLLRATAKVQASADSDAAAAAAGEQQQQDGAAAAAVGGGDALQYRPNPQALISKVPLVGDTAGLSSEAAATGGGVYRPPKLNPVAMPEDRAVSNKEMRQIREAQRRAQRSAVMRELAQELAGAPEEVGAELPGMDTAAAVAARQRLEARAAAEEELMLRVPLSKAEAKKLKAQRRAGLSGAVGLTDFADDVADLVATSTAAEGGGGGGAGGSGLSELFGKHKLSQRYGADLSAQQQAQIRSGDADVELRKPLHERRAAFDAVAARRAAAAADADMDGGGGGGYGDDEYDYEAFAGRGGKGMGSSGKKRQRGDGFGGGEEDEFYTAAKAGRASSKAAKAAAHAVPAHLEPPLPEPEAVGQRKISYEIEKNRGLTPHRRKDLKNPRKKHRVKFAQAVVRRKGQVQGMQQAPSSARGYGGEATGIKSRVSKSTRLG